MLRGLADDQLFVHRIKPHSLDKIIRHNFYVRVFSTSMKNKWPQRAYLGLYSGPGRAVVEGSGEIVETSAMGAVRVPDPFSHYIFVDRDERCTDALHRRIEAAECASIVKLINGNVNDSVAEIRAALPRFSRDKGLLTFCFVDPFAANLKFSTIRALATYKMDFLILLMLGRDVRTNFKQYLEDESNNRIAELIDCPDWRSEFTEAREGVIRFLLRKFDEAMVGLGYRPSRADLVHQVKIARKNVFLYSLVFYSRHEIAENFWRETLARTDPQTSLDL